MGCSTNYKLQASRSFDHMVEPAEPNQSSANAVGNVTTLVCTVQNIVARLKTSREAAKLNATMKGVYDQIMKTKRIDSAGCADVISTTDTRQSTSSFIEKWSQERNKRDSTPTALRDGRNDTDPDTQPLQHPPDPDWSPCRRRL
jgi:hypothetical protein